MTNTKKFIKDCAIVLAIFLIVGIFSGIMQLCSFIFEMFSKNSNVVSEMKAHDLTDAESVKNLDVMMDKAILKIKNGEAFSVESDHEYLNVYVKNGTLTMEDETPFGEKNSNRMQVILTIPSGFSFDRVKMETGAGRLEVESLRAERLHMKLGAGESVFENLTVTDEAEIKTGVGKFSVLNGSIADLDLKMGAGDISVKTELREDGIFDCGIGNAEIFLIGSKEEYCISVHKGIGLTKAEDKLVLNGEKFENGDIPIAVNGGIGDIQIQFIEKE